MNHILCLHEHGVLHNDLEPWNVVSASGQLKVIDFGMSELGHSCGGASECLSLLQLRKDGIQQQMFRCAIIEVRPERALLSKGAFVLYLSDFGPIPDSRIALLDLIFVASSSTGFLCTLSTIGAGIRFLYEIQKPRNNISKRLLLFVPCL